MRRMVIIGILALSFVGGVQAGGKSPATEEGGEKQERTAAVKKKLTVYKVKGPSGQEIYQGKDLSDVATFCVRFVQVYLGWSIETIAVDLE